jgi:hypothetical protein
VTEDWCRERDRVVANFDNVADLYRRFFSDELERKPFDRALLDRLAAMFPGGRAVLEVGAGPGHIGAYLARHGVSMVVSDASAGQLHEARIADEARPLLAADLRSLPVAPVSLAGIVGFYGLIYGPAEALDGVFADWQDALVPGGVVVVAVHAGVGELHHGDWHGRAVDMTVARRDPDDLARRMEGAGLTVLEQTIRPPYKDEGVTDRCYVVARRSPA